MSKIQGVRRIAPLATALFLSSLGVEQARASESGASLYLLGSGGPGAALMPPLKGVYFASEQYYYNGSASGAKQFVVGGNVVAGLDAKIIASFPTALWVPSTDVAGGVLGLGLTVPLGEPDLDVSAVIAGPQGQSTVSRSDSSFIVADPVAMAMLGWKSGKAHVQTSLTVNIPIGRYREDQLANLALHRWAADTSLAATWLDEESGWDVSGKIGFTFNGENPHTDYTTGAEFHAEASLEKTFSPSWSGGLQAYYFDQVSGDSGQGAVLGPFKGKAAGVGATMAYHFKLGNKPAALRFRAFTEFDVKNRLEGESFWLGFSVPLSMKMPVAR